MIISSFWNSKTKIIETIFSGSIEGNTVSKESVKKYIDSYLPVEFRSIDGKDTLVMRRIDKVDLTRMGYSDKNGENCAHPTKFPMRF